MGLILGQEAPLEKEVESTSVFFPGKSPGQRSLVGYDLWGLRVRHDWGTKDSDDFSLYLVLITWSKANQITEKYKENKV